MRCPSLSGAARLALFRTCHALSRLVLAHTPEGEKTMFWDATYAEEEQGEEGGGEGDPDHILSPKASLPSQPPPAALTQHITSLVLSDLSFSMDQLLQWQLHTWPHLQSLTIDHCCAPSGVRKPASFSVGPLPPISRLRTLILERTTQLGWAELYTTLALCAHARKLSLHDLSCGGLKPAVRRLPHLTHLHTDFTGAKELRRLLTHPTLRHVTLSHTLGMYDEFHLEHDMSALPCTWRTLTLDSPYSAVRVDEVGLLPVRGLERLRLVGALGTSGAIGPGVRACTGLPALQHLHQLGRLVLAPSRWAWLGARFQLGWEHASFSIGQGGGRLEQLLRLVVEAAPDVNTLCLDAPGLLQNMMMAMASVLGGLPAALASLPSQVQRVAPALQRAGRITTLCIWLPPDAFPQPWDTLLGALPACVTELRVRCWACRGGTSPTARSLLRGAGALHHRLRVVFLHEGALSSEEEAALRELVGSGGVGEARLTLELVQVEPTEEDDE